MSNSTLILDGDGVIIDFSSGFANYMQAVHKITPLSIEPAHFNYADAYPMLEKPAAYIPGFIDSEYFERTPLYEGAAEKLREIKAQGHTLLMVTSCGDAEHVKAMRTRMLMRELGPIIDDIIFLPLASSKVDALKRLPKGVFVDDQLTMCIDGTQAGHQSFLFNRRYNQHLPVSDLITHNIHRMYSFDCLPHIGHDNGPRTVLERQSLAVLTSMLHDLESTELSETQRRAELIWALSNAPLNLPPQAKDLLIEYVKSPEKTTFTPLDRPGGLLDTLQRHQSLPVETGDVIPMSVMGLRRR